MPAPINIALAGVGDHMREQILPAIRNLEFVLPVAVVTRSPIKIEFLKLQYPLITSYTTIDELVTKGKGVEAVICVGPPDYQLSILMKCADAGIPVFIEKPGILNSTKLEDIQKTIVQKGGFIFTGYNFAYSSTFLEYKNQTAQCGNRIYEEITFFANKPTHPIWNLPDILSSLLYAIGVHALSLAYERLQGCFTLKLLSSSASGAKVMLLLSAKRAEHEIVIKLSNGYPYFHWKCEYIDESHRCVSLDNFGTIRKKSVNALSEFRETVTTISSPQLRLGFSILGYQEEIKEMLRVVRARNPKFVAEIHDRDRCILKACEQLLEEFGNES